MIKPEILAPVGSAEALHAAVNAGADACYLGGSRFGARAFADNFDVKELIEAIRYAHLYGVKVYMTVNTLFRNEEISELYDYLIPYYRAGLDAVIVQDFGVMEYIHYHFPDLSIHASTQMTITTPYAYELLKDYGVTRIVPARELSLDEIRKLKKTNAHMKIEGCTDSISKDEQSEKTPSGMVTPEIEVFVQGALCICYSGQCLMSSFIGGRSGNRGRCAGSCRLPYSLYDINGNNVATDGQYLLSQKDLCGVLQLPDLIEAGVDSFKIEGRMKKPEYVAACVRSYRRLVDYYFSSDYNQETYVKKALVYKDEMTEIFNRGGFTSGYYYQNNGKDMMSFNEPGHMGVDIGKISRVNDKSIMVRLSKNLNKGDILVVKAGNEEITMTSNIDDKNGSEVILNVSKSKKLKKGMSVFRKFNAPLDAELSKYYSEDRKLIVSGELSLKSGAEMLFKVSSISDNRNYDVTVCGEVVEKATSKPVTKEVILSKIRQTGNSCFEFSDLKIDMDEDIFIPVKALKDIRRKALSKLKDVICDSYNRTESCYKINCDNNYNNLPEINSNNNVSQDESSKLIQSNSEERINNDSQSPILVLVSKKEQLEAVKAYGDRVKISIDLQYFEKEDIITLMDNYPEYIYALPMILRKNSLKELDELPLNKCKGVIIRNIDELSYMKSIGYEGNVIADYSLYAMNDQAAHFIRSQFLNADITIPVELNKKQLYELSYSDSNSALIVYGFQPLMVMASCFRENTTGCNKGANTSYVMKDRRNQKFYINTICKYCYNIVYNGIPTVLYDKDDIAKYNGILRFCFVSESENEVTSVLDSYFNDKGFHKEYTRGHFSRGVD